MSFSSRLAGLALILTLMLTGIGLGAARGVVRQGDQIVLCTGHGVVVTRLPVGEDRAHLCPDMALSLMAAIGGATPGLPLRVARVRGFQAVQVRVAIPVPGRAWRVRDPPAGVA